MCFQSANGPWSTTSTPATSSIQQIQQEEAKSAAASQVQGSTSQLKSLLGVKVQTEQSESKGGWAVGPTASAGNASKPAKSLKEIMKQEEQQLKQIPDTARPAPNSWAAKIAAGGSHPPPSTATPKPVSTPQQAPKPQNQVIQPQASRPLPEISGMSAEMVEWCITSMKKIIGADFDGKGLLEILVSLESPTDIREIISEILGSVPLSSQFATEFIKRKANGSGMQKSASSKSKGK